MDKRTKDKLSRITRRIGSQIWHLHSHTDDAMDKEIIVDIAKLIYRDAENALQLAIGKAEKSSREQED